jgi:signal transduction histidine kinase
MKQMFSFSKPVTIAISSASSIAILVYYFVALTNNLLTPLQKYMVPAYLVTSVTLTLCIIFFHERHLIRLQILLKIYAGFLIFISMVEGALVPNSNIELLFVWLPIYYIAIIFGAETDFIRKVGLGFITSCSLAVIIALCFSERSYSDPDVILMIVAILGQTIIVWIFYQIAKTLRKSTVAEIELELARQNEEKFRLLADKAQKSKEESEAARESAVQANAFKSNFVANMSHELRTPLNAIIGFAQLLKKSSGIKITEDVLEDYTNNIESAGEHLLSLINDILDISKIEAGKAEVLEEEINVSELIKDMATYTTSLTDDASLEFELMTAENLPNLMGDNRKIKQMLINLISNSVKFTPKGGKITLSAKTNEDGGIQFCSIDTGIGMKTSQIETLMKPFEQAEHSYAKSTGGTGLGLSLVSALCKLHSAEFEIESAIGKGTRASIIFPKERSIDT